jgi:uncharacterized membrane protein YedE/YeeE
MKSGATRDRLGSAVLGLAMGGVLSRAGFSDYAQVHAMFTFADLRLVATFAFAVAAGAVGLRLLVRREDRPARRLHPGTIPGGFLLGAGWALCGACPAIVWVQLGEGRIAGALSLAGILAGMAAYPRIHRRLFRWPGDACA